MAQPFTPDGSGDALETPRNPLQSLSITAFARFEFEPGRGNEGTKILMVEWEDDDFTRPTAGSWHVSWDGKKAVLPADERTSESTRRFYFLLPPGVTIPPTVTLTFEPPPESASTAKKADTVQMNPLPAIFPPELGSSARQAGKKGVLHTIWAKKRLQVLEKEIHEEEQYNLEGIALEMASQERAWIEENFGVTAKPRELSLGSSNSSGSPYPAGPPLSPLSPRSPTSGRRMSEKLKGLKLGTSERELAAKLEQPNPTFELDSHPLSPESPDVAVSSFSSFRNTPISAAAAARKKPFAQSPPDFIKAQQQTSDMSSLAFIARQRSRETHRESRDPEDELFAKPLSPRTPDVSRSPFSFSSHETMPYITRKLTEGSQRSA